MMETPAPWIVAELLIWLVTSLYGIYLLYCNKNDRITQTMVSWFTYNKNAQREVRRALGIVLTIYGIMRLTHTIGQHIILTQISSAS